MCYCLGLTTGLTWSPDGKQLAFIGPLIKPNEPPSSQTPSGQFYVNVVNADGSDLRSLGVKGNGRP
jgi:Tol biopolymer transport system component